MRISPVYNPKNIINNPPQITNHPLLEHLQFHNQEFKANEKEILLKKIKQEKTKDNFMTFLLVSMLTITGVALYTAYQKLKNGLKKI